MNIRYPIYEGVYRILTVLLSATGTLHFTLTYIYTLTKVKWFPVCAANSGSRG